MLRILLAFPAVVFTNATFCSPIHAPRNPEVLAYGVKNGTQLTMMVMMDADELFSIHRFCSDRVMIKAAAGFWSD